MYFSLICITSFRLIIIILPRVSVEAMWGTPYNHGRLKKAVAETDQLNGALDAWHTTSSGLPDRDLSTVTHDAGRADRASA